MNKKQLLILALLVAALSAWFALDLGQYLQLAVVQERMADMRSWYRQNPLLAGLAYFLIYVAVTGLSVPGAAVMTFAVAASPSATDV